MEDAIREIELKHNFKFKDKQISAIESILKDNDTFIVLPTGYGKSKIYAHLPEIYKILGLEATVLVISPLQALMIDQFNKFNQLGIALHNIWSNIF